MEHLCRFKFNLIVIKYLHQEVIQAVIVSHLRIVKIQYNILMILIKRIKLFLIIRYIKNDKAKKRLIHKFDF